MRCVILLNYFRGLKRRLVTPGPGRGLGQIQRLEQELLASYFLVFLRRFVQGLPTCQADRVLVGCMGLGSSIRAAAGIWEWV